MPFYLLKGDLLKSNVDAIVNDANVNLKMVEGVGRAIFHACGDVELTNACKEIGRCEPGNAVITPSFNLKTAKYIIHAVAPIYMNGKHGEEKLLRSAYKKVFELAKENNVKSIAFPFLGGEYNWDKKDCFDIAVDEITNFLKENNNVDVYMVMYKNFPIVITEGLQEKISKFIISNFRCNEEENPVKVTPNFKKYWKDNYSKTINPEEFVLKANISMDKFNEIINDKSFGPSKVLAISLALGLGLKHEEFFKFLAMFSYSLNHSSYFDLIILCFVESGITDIQLINRALFTYSFIPLGEKY